MKQCGARGLFVVSLLHIAKVFPTNRLEQLPGGAGIVLDDVMADLYTLICC
jgi:phosphatidylglycerophosphatase A